MAYTRHGKTNTRTYRIWRSMLNRCHNENSYNRKNYLEKGITVCDRWRESFVNFLEDMGEAPAGMSIERKDGAKGYCKDNCKWATRIEQNNNRINTRMVKYRGEVKSLADWCREFGIKYYTARTRLDEGRPLDEVFSTKDYRGDRKPSRMSVMIEYEGRSQTLTQWCRELGLNYYTVRTRFAKGYPVSDVLFKGKFPSVSR